MVPTRGQKTVEASHEPRRCFRLSRVSAGSFVPPRRALFLSRRLRSVMLSTAVKKQIPICRLFADAVRWEICSLSWTLVLFAAFNGRGAHQPAARPPPAVGSTVPAAVNKYCVSCHDTEVKKGGLDLDSILQEDVTQHPEAWER